MRRIRSSSWIMRGSLLGDERMEKGLFKAIYIYTT
jgi:hypothetical protein